MYNAHLLTYLQFVLGYLALQFKSYSRQKQEAIIVVIGNWYFHLQTELSEAVWLDAIDVQIFRNWLSVESYDGTYLWH